MNYKIYDYVKSDFKRQLDDWGNWKYYIRVNKKFNEVTREQYLVCFRSYMKIIYDRKREVARSIYYTKDIDRVTSFILSTKSTNINTQLYIKDLANLAIQEIHKLPDKYKDIAICIFLNEMTIAETSLKLGIPISTVGKRKIKIQKILKNILKNGEINF